MKNLHSMDIAKNALSHKELFAIRGGDGGNGNTGGGAIRTGEGTNHGNTVISIRNLEDGTIIKFYIDPITGQEIVVEIIPPSTP